MVFFVFYFIHIYILMWLLLFYIGPFESLVDVVFVCVCYFRSDFLKNRIKINELLNLSRMLLSSTQFVVVDLQTNQQNKNKKSSVKQVSNGSLLADDWLVSVSRLIWCWDAARFGCCSFFFLFLFLTRFLFAHNHHWNMSLVNMRERTKWCGQCELQTNIQIWCHLLTSHFKPVLFNS